MSNSTSTAANSRQGLGQVNGDSQNRNIEEHKTNAPPPTSAPVLVVRQGDALKPENLTDNAKNRGIASSGEEDPSNEGGQAEPAGEKSSDAQDPKARPSTSDDDIALHHDVCRGTNHGQRIADL